ncbi:MAG: PAS domain S-box protein [Candidatus Zixiibacteriota bacterium]|nr:MAG: PAS domain S-box protein [candidate division Zixibacteria bacterium]
MFTAMSGRSTIVFLAGVFSAAVIVVTGSVLFILYEAAFDQQRVRLTEIVQSRARLMEAIARFDALHSTDDVGGGAFGATMMQITEAHEGFKGLGESGELTLGKRQQDQIIFMLRHRHSDVDHPRPVNWNSTFAEPMRRALQGKSGTMVGLDYRGERVLAAYEPVAILDLGAVAKMDLAEIRAPFVRAGLVAAGVAFILLAGGILIFFSVGSPMAHRLQASEKERSIQNAILRAFLMHPHENIYGEVLAIVIEALQSKHGVFGYLDEEGNLVCESMTDEVWKQCRMDDRSIVFPAGTWGRTIWGRAISEQAPRYCNRELRVPDGHIQMKRAAAVPVLYSSESIGLLMVANKDSDYTENDLAALQRIADFIAPVLKARLQKLFEETARTRVEAALRASEDRYRHLVEEAQDAIYSISPEGKITSLNAAFETITGWSRDEWLGKSFEQLLHPDDQVPAAAFIEDIERGESPSAHELRIRTKDGRYVTGEFRETVLRHRGEPAGVLGVARDITERKKTEQALKESEEKYRRLVNHATIGIVVAQDDRVRFVNPRIQTYTGYSAKELLSKPFVEFVHPDDRDRALRNHHMRLAGTPVPEPGELRILHRDGSARWIEVDGVLISWEGRPAVLNFVSDITLRKEMDAEMVRTEKLESIGVLAGGIAHDFNNLLTGIGGNVSLAASEIGPDSEAQVFLSDADRALVRAQDLTRQLLTFSKGGAPVKKTASIAEIIEESSRFALRGSNVECCLSFDTELWSAEVDAGQISQVMQNLVLNADQAMPEGGMIKIIGENTVLSETSALPLKPGNYLRISVSDEGTGIPGKHLQKIFDPFFTTKRKGSGLGLASTFTILRNHGGHISCESELGEGTTFILYLPASESPPIEESELVVASVVGSGRVLVMDDEEVVRNVTVKSLTRAGYDVDWARDGLEAVNKFLAADQKGLSYEVVILDLTVPGRMGGQQAIKEIREIDPEVRAIVCSGYSNNPVLTDFAGSGFDGIVAKPFKPDELVRVVQEVTNAAGCSAGTV